MPTSQRSQAASRPTVPVVTRPSTSAVPVVPGVAPSKPPVVNRPQAVQAVRPAPARAPDRWNALPDSRSCTGNVPRAGACGPAGPSSKVDRVPPDPAPGSSSGSPADWEIEGPSAQRHLGACPRTVPRAACPTPHRAPVPPPCFRSARSRPWGPGRRWRSCLRPGRPRCAPPVGFDSSRTNLSFPSSTTSSSNSTETVFAVPPGAKVSVPRAAR